MKQEDRKRKNEDLSSYIHLLFSPTFSVMRKACFDDDSTPMEDETFYGALALFEIVEKRVQRIAELLEEKVGKIWVQSEWEYLALSGEILDIQIKAKEAGDVKN